MNRQALKRLGRLRAEEVRLLEELPSKTVAALPATGGGLPSVFRDSSVRGVTPIDAGRNRIGIAFQYANGDHVRLAIAPEQAVWLIESLTDYLNTGRQSSRLSDSPKADGSPQEGQ